MASLLNKSNVFGATIPDQEGPKYMRHPDKLYKIPSPLPFQTPGEETANSILHGLGVLLSITGLVLLTLRSTGHLGGAGGGAPAVFSFVVFTASMISMFLASTLYHSIQHEGAKRVFRIMDHSAIYLLIAGTYTPYCLLVFKGTLGWVYFCLEWGLAAVGIILYSAQVKFIKKTELVVYLLMGWAVIISILKLFNALPKISFILLVAGGVVYTMGLFWYNRGNRRWAHVIWHVFVLAGATGHWFSMWFLS
jgi:hemolysin III